MPLAPGSRRTAISFVVATMVIFLLLGGTLLVPSRSASGMQPPSRDDVPVSGTPVAAAAEPRDPVDGDRSPGASIAGDPLDGDPLDGPPADGDRGAPVDQTELEIVRSARPHDEPATVVAYDDDPRTVWTPRADAGETWLWLDLGLERPLREVRWLAEGRGTVEIAVSSDRQRWRDVDRVDVDDGWQGVELRDDARYVRLTLLPADDGGELPAIAEATIYGPDKRAACFRPNSGLMTAANGIATGSRVATGNRLPSRKPKATIRQVVTRNESNLVPAVEFASRPNQERPAAAATVNAARRDRARSRSRTTASAKAPARSTSVPTAAPRSVTPPAATRRKRATARGRRGGRGGRCEAVANGGAVAIGDVNP